MVGRDPASAELTFLADVTGTATDPDGNLFRWTLAYQQIDGAPKPTGPWTEIARGYGPIDPAAHLGTLDPTLDLL